MSAAVENGGSGGDLTSHTEEAADRLNDHSDGENNRTFPKKPGAMEGATPTTGAAKPEPASTIGAAVGDFVVRCRGLPWSCTEDDIKEFLGRKNLNNFLCERTSSVSLQPPALM